MNTVFYTKLYIGRHVFYQKLKLKNLYKFSMSLSLLQKHVANDYFAHTNAHHSHNAYSSQQLRG